MIDKERLFPSGDIVRAFVRLRRMLSGNKELSRKLDELEKKYDAKFKIVFDAIRKLMTPESKSLPKMGIRQT